MNIEEIRKLNDEELVKEQETLIRNIMENRFKHKSMQLSDTSQINKPVSYTHLTLPTKA